MTYINEKEIEEILKQSKQKKKWKLVKNISIIAATFAVAATAFFAGSSFMESMQNNNLNDEVRTLAVNDTEYVVNEETNETMEFSNIDFNSLEQINADTVGWIECPGTNINYPVVQSTDNDYYLNHSFDGSQNSAGSIYLDYRDNENMNNKVSIIYGHNRIDDSMFGTLNNYRDQNYYNEHSKMYYHTADAVYELNIFGVVKEDATHLYTTDYENMDEASVLAEMERIKANSYIESNVDLSLDDNIICLYTCLDMNEKSGNRDERTLVYATTHKVLDKTMENTSSKTI